MTDTDADQRERERERLSQKAWAEIGRLRASIAEELEKVRATPEEMEEELGVPQEDEEDRELRDEVERYEAEETGRTWKAITEISERNRRGGK